MHILTKGARYSNDGKEENDVRFHQERKMSAHATEHENNSALRDISNLTQIFPPQHF